MCVPRALREFGAQHDSLGHGIAHSVYSSPHARQGSTVLGHALTALLSYASLVEEHNPARSIHK